MRRLSGKAIVSSAQSRDVKARRGLLALAVTVALSWLPVLGIKGGVMPNLLFLGSYQADLLAVLFILSIALTILGLLTLAGSAALDRVALRSRIVEREAQAEFHRNFLRRLDHEIHSPLTTIRIGLLNLEHKQTPDRAERLSRIMQQAQRLQKLTEELRYLGEIEEYQVEHSKVDVQHMLGEIVELVCGMSDYLTRIVESQIQQVPWPLPLVSGDPDLLFMAIRNLLDNALKYTRPNDKVVIRAFEDRHMVLLEIADTGIGIAPDDLTHVFEELYRGQNARLLPGNGLGLALVQRIINLHGGKIQIQSRLDQGTSLKVWLPCAGVN